MGAKTVAVLEEWMRAGDFEAVARADRSVCLHAGTRKGIPVAVVWSRYADKREYTRLFSVVDRLQSAGNLVYIATTGAGLRHAKRVLETRGAGILRITKDGTVVVDAEPRQV